MIESLHNDNIKDCVKLAYALWRDAEYTELLDDFTHILASDKEECFLFYDNEHEKEYLGFVQVSLRHDYVEGSNSSPVAYIEGIYVVEKARRKGIAKLLVERAKEWGRARGCSELASDCLLSNNQSIDFHKGIGFEEVNRLVCFIKNI